MTAPSPQPPCQCALHGPLICPNVAEVSCFACGRALCLRCSKPILVYGASARVCEPTAIDALCFRAVGLRQNYAGVAS